jgi:hypothetical protein
MLMLFMEVLTHKTLLPSMLQVVQIHMVLITWTVADVQNGVRLVGTIGSEEGIEAGIRLDVDKHAGGP